MEDRLCVRTMFSYKELKTRILQPEKKKGFFFFFNSDAEKQVQGWCLWRRVSTRIKTPIFLPQNTLHLAFILMVEKWLLHLQASRLPSREVESREE